MSQPSFSLFSITCSCFSRSSFVLVAIRTWSCPRNEFILLWSCMFTNWWGFSASSHLMRARDSFTRSSLWQVNTQRKPFSQRCILLDLQVCIWLWTSIANMQALRSTRCRKYSCRGPRRKAICWYSLELCVSHRPAIFLWARSYFIACEKNISCCGRAKSF
jgi:hypothetical protein